MRAILAFALASVLYRGCDVPLPPESVRPSPTPVGTPVPLPTPDCGENRCPTPTPTPDEPTALCNLPPSTSNECSEDPRGASEFLSAVQAAQGEIRVDGVVVSHTNNPGQYTDTLAEILRQGGYCAQPGRGIEDEVWVKKSNDFSEHFDVVTSNGDIWSKFAARCAFAAF